MLSVELIGRPRLTREGVPAPATLGAKSWAVLARVIRSAEPVTRQQLASELFSEAEDPLAALRWTLTEVRRSLDQPDALRGNPVSPALGDGVEVDVGRIGHCELPDPCPHGTLLEGVTVHGSPTFEMWLLIERQRVNAELLAVLRREALDALIAADVPRALRLAQLMLELAPLDEGAHILLVRALVASGDPLGAQRHVDTAAGLFRRELGLAPSAQLLGAVTAARPRTGEVSRSPATARALLASGRQALAAGAAADGVSSLRRAVEATRGGQDRFLEAMCAFELGAALVHAVRGFDDEGTVLLHAAHEAALAAGAREIAANSLAELAYIEVLAARRESAAARLAEAWAAAEGLPRVRAEVAAFDAVHLTDWGRIEESLTRFEEARDLCEATGSTRRGIWALACAARTAYLAGWHHAAVAWAQEAIARSRREVWPAIRPWPAVWLAHARLALGEAPAAIREALAPEYALARQLDDPCWTASAAKATALTFAAERDLEQAGRWLDDALAAAHGKPDTYRWVEVDVTVAAAENALARGRTGAARELARRALEGAARGDMPALLERSTRVFEAVGHAG